MDPTNATTSTTGSPEPPPAFEEPLKTLRPPRRRSLPEDVTEQLLEMIASRRFANDRLPTEQALCQQLGVSRGPLREGLSVLYQLGIVHTRGKAKIGQPAAASIQLAAISTTAPEQVLVEDPLEARRMLEPEVAARAAERATPEALAQIEHWLTCMEQAGDESPTKALEYDVAFHLAIARATGNSVLVSLVQALSNAAAESRSASWLVPDGLAKSLRDHRLIMAALRHGNSVAARSSMAEHLDRIEVSIRKVIEGMGDP